MVNDYLDPKQFQISCNQNLALRRVPQHIAQSQTVLGQICKKGLTRRPEKGLFSDCVQLPSSSKLRFWISIRTSERILRISLRTRLHFQCTFLTGSGYVSVFCLFRTYIEDFNKMELGIIQLSFLVFSSGLAHACPYTEGWQVLRDSRIRRTFASKYRVLIIL